MTIGPFLVSREGVDDSMNRLGMIVRERIAIIAWLRMSLLRIVG